MRVVSNLVHEFEEIKTEYSNFDQQGQDIATLVVMFGDEYDYFDEDTDSLDFKMAWEKFLGEHSHQVNSNMVGLIIHLLVTYWQQGHQFFKALPPLEKILARDTVQEISEEIDRRSAANGDAVLVVPD